MPWFSRRYELWNGRDVVPGELLCVEDEGNIRQLEAAGLVMFAPAGHHIERDGDSDLWVVVPDGEAPADPPALEAPAAPLPEAKPDGEAELAAAQRALQLGTPFPATPPGVSPLMVKPKPKPKRATRTRKTTTRRNK